LRIKIPFTYGGCEDNASQNVSLDFLKPQNSPQSWTLAYLPM
jgi:hypothetical protein